MPVLSKPLFLQEARRGLKFIVKSTVSGKKVDFGGGFFSSLPKNGWLCHAGVAIRIYMDIGIYYSSRQF